MKLRAVHLRTNYDDDRESRSYNDVMSLINYGVEYAFERNAVYAGEVPESRYAPDRPFVLTPAHYGCYKAHRDAIDRYLTDDIDALLVFECDACFTEATEVFYNRIIRAYGACIEGNLDVFTFGPKHAGKTIDTVCTDVIVITQFIETHAYMIPIKSKQLFKELFSLPWDALDYVYTVYLYDQWKKRIGTFKDRAASYQATGVSLITGEIKDTEKHWKYKKYD